MKNYNIGLDIGTSSVGWAVVEDETNKVMKKGGKALWGVRLFDEARTAEDRRISRGTRRRYDRRRERIKLLRDEFTEEINKVDPNFFQKLDESKYDIKDINNKTIKISKEERELVKKYYEEYPTIYHLRKKLINSSEKMDIRLVYLAIHHIIKYRGNFLYEGKSFNANNLNIVGKLQDIFNALSENVLELDISEECINSMDYQKMVDIFDEQSKNDLRVDLTNELKSYALNKNFINELPKLIVGNKFSAKKLFNLESDTDVSLNFNGTDFEDKLGDLEKLLGDYLEILEQLKELYDMVFLKKMFNGSKEISLSSLMVERFHQHKYDLNLLKTTLKKDREVYNKLFRSKKEIIKDADMCLYDLYIHNKLETVDFLNELKKYINADKFIINDEMFLKRLENNDILPKITTKENGKYPYQLNRDELIKIIENQGKYYPTLLNKIDDNTYKLVRLLEFRIPYFVGPLVSSEMSKNAWMVRNEGKEYIHITPYNFNEVVNKDKTAELFIKRMISHCTYLLNEEALPSDSILYSEFKVLNELKQIKINNEHLTQEQQHKILNDLFKKSSGQITDSKFTDFILNELDYSFYDNELKVTGYSADNKFANNMQSYIDFFGDNGIFKNTSYGKEDAEKIIEWITIFDDYDILERKVRNEYQELSDNQLKNILSKKYSGWGRLSKKLLLDLKIKSKETNIPKSIMDLMYETDENFMQIINNDEYNFQSLIAKENKIDKKNKELSYDIVANLATSPKTKRGIYQALKVVKEITEYIGYDPKNIMVEMARGDEKKVRKDDRKEYLLKLYNNIKGEVNDNYKRLKKELVSEEKIDTDKLYLYYLQEGKCLYCGKPIDVDDLKSKNSLFEIDHILPRTLIKDNSWDNRVLVCRECNQKKGASLVLPKDFRTEYMRSIWTRLKDNKLMSNKKFYSLTRSRYSEEDIKGFINRQLVETRQITKHVANILDTFYPKTKVVYLKANISHSYRDRYELFKFRDINDYHHAHDAYLAAVLGNYQEKYLHYDLDYSKINEFNAKLKESQDYKALHYGIVVNSLDERFQNAFVLIAPNLIDSETGSVFNSKEFNSLIEDTLYRNDIMVSKKTEIGTGKLFNDTIYKRKVGKIRIKKNMPTELYGGYSSVKTSYLSLVKYGDKIKLVGIPLSIALQNNVSLKLDFLKEHLNLKTVDSLEVLKDKIPFNTCINYRGQNAYVTGYSVAHKSCELSNAHQLKIKRNIFKRHKYMLNKVYNNKFDSATQDDINNAVKFINYLYEMKKEYPLISSKIENIENGLKLEDYSFEELAQIIKQLLTIYCCNSVNGNLKNFGLSNCIGRLSDLNITNGTFIFKSVTGLKESNYSFGENK